MAEMTEVAKGVATHQRLVALLTQENARYRVVSHEAVGKCEAVSEIRGTALGQGAKALVCKVKGNGVNQHVLAILAADQQADLSQLASHLGGLRASLASPAEVDMLTGCVFGAIPPFSFHPNLKLVADPLLFERFDEIAFNAGLLEKSVIMNTQDYLRIARPELAVFRRFQSSPTAFPFKEQYRHNDNDKNGEKRRRNHQRFKKRWIVHNCILRKTTMTVHLLAIRGVDDNLMITPFFT